MSAKYYKAVTARQVLKTTQEEYETLKAALEADNREDSYSKRGEWLIDYLDGQVHIFASFTEKWWSGPPTSRAAATNDNVAGFPATLRHFSLPERRINDGGRDPVRGHHDRRRARGHSHHHHPRRHRVLRQVGRARAGLDCGA